MRARAVLASALLAALPCRATAAPQPAPRAPEASEGALADLRDLLRGLGGDDPLLRESAGRELASLPLDRLDTVLDVLFYRVPPAAPEPEQGAEVALLSVPAEQALLARLATWPSDRVALACLRRARAGGLSERLRALELVGACARAGDWDALVLLCGTLTEEELAHPLASERIPAALEALVARDPAVLRAIRRSLDDDPPWLLRALGEALGRHGGRETAELCPALLEREAALDLVVLKALGQRERWSAGLPTCVELLEAWLRAPDPDARRAAACSLGRLKAGRALPALILALDDAHAGVRRSALWSLRYATGLDFLTSFDEWSAWYEREDEWRAERAGALAAAITTGSAGEAVAAVVELGQHPWFEDLAPEVLPALDHPDLMVAQAACGALAAIGDALSYQTLLERCDDPRRAVRGAARVAFEALVGSPFVPSED